MDAPQVSTNTELDQGKTGEIVEPEQAKKLLSLQQDQWITYCAIGGIITEQGFENVYNTTAGRELPQIINKMSVTDFAKQLGVDRTTLYYWQNHIPDFGNRVRERREQMFPVARETALFNQAYLIAMTGRGQAAADMIRMLLGHFSQLQLPKQRNEIDAGQNLMDLVNAARKKNIIEGEVTDGQQTPNA